MNVSNTPIYLAPPDKEKLKILSSMLQRSQSDTVRVLIRGAYTLAQNESLQQILPPVDLHLPEIESISPQSK